MTPLELALAGFAIFPLDAASKKPFKGFRWHVEASSDPARIADWIHRYPNCGWGIDCGKSGLVVIDDDQGKNPAAIASLDALEAKHGGLPETLTVQTRSGGYHYYYRGSSRNSASSKLGPGLDSRGDGGYVVAPGTPGYVIESDAPIAPAPPWLITLLGAPVTRAADREIPAVALDTPEAIARAKAYLDVAPDAPGPRHGGGGGYHTIKVACRIRDFGISEAVCTELIHGSAWAQRIEPPWDDWDELAEKVGRAYRYAKDRIGNSNPEGIFSPVDVPAPPAPKVPLVDWDTIRDQEIRVNYLVHERIETPSTGLIFGDPSAGKSFLALDLALGVATGTAWQGHMAKPGAVVYFAGEGRQGLRRRTRAWEAHHGVRAAKGRLWISDYRVEFENASLTPVVEQMDAIQTSGTPIALCVVDTLARHIASGSDENSAKDVGNLLNLCDSIRDRYGCVVAIVHHSGKMAKDTSRGSSAIRGAMDWEIMVSASGEARKAAWTKQKEGEIPPPQGFTLEEIDIGGGHTSAVPLPCAVVADPGAGLSEGARKALAILRLAISESGGESVSREAWRAAFKGSISAPISRATLSARFRRAEEALSTSGEIHVDGETVRLETTAID